jgi:hypothetical protein
MRKDDQVQHAKFVSLCSCNKELFALAEDGTVWMAVWENQDWGEPERWREVGVPAFDRRATAREARR